MVLHLWRLLPNHFSVWLRQLLYIKWYNIVVADFPGMMQDIQNLTLDCFFFYQSPKIYEQWNKPFSKTLRKKKIKGYSQIRIVKWQIFYWIVRLLDTLVYHELMTAAG